MAGIVKKPSHGKTREHMIGMLILYGYTVAMHDAQVTIVHPGSILAAHGYAAHPTWRPWTWEKTPLHLIAAEYNRHIDDAEKERTWKCLP